MLINSNEDNLLSGGPSLKISSIEKPSFEEVNIVGAREQSAFSIRRDASEGIPNKSSKVLLSRVASDE